MERTRASLREVFWEDDAARVHKSGTMKFEKGVAN